MKLRLVIRNKTDSLSDGINLSEPLQTSNESFVVVMKCN